MSETLGQPSARGAPGDCARDDCAPGVPTPGFLVWRLSNKWRVAVDRALAPLDLTHAQYVLLAALYGMERGGLEFATGGAGRSGFTPPRPARHQPSQRELAEHTGLEALYVSKLARSLEADGFLERVRDPDDTRTMRLTLSARGREVISPAIEAVQVLVDRLLAPLGGQDDPRTEAFVHDLTTLLAAPLD